MSGTGAGIGNDSAGVGAGVSVAGGIVGSILEVVMWSVACGVEDVEGETETRS